MSQRYNENIKRPKSQDTQLGILKIYLFCQKIQCRVSDPGESTAGVIYLSMRIHLKSSSICMSPLKVSNTLLNGTRNDTIGALVVTQLLRLVSRLHANTSSPGYSEGNTRPVGLFGTMPQEPRHLEKGAEWDWFIQLNFMEMCTHANYETIRTWENLTTNEQK